MIIIGEKINGFVPRTGTAIKENDADYIRELAIRQTEAGADYLDCCPATNEGALEVMKWLVDLIQEVCATPICLDSPDPDILIQAMEFCDRPGIINSVSVAGKTEKLFPLIAGTGWKCIAMLDDAAGRIAVFNRLLDEMDEAGINADQVYVDPLVETLGTNETSLLTFTEVCREVKKICPDIHLTSGLSNISFGLPVRKMINMAFMVLAMNAGMDSAIVDPLNRDMMGVIYATRALLGEDEFCVEYLGAYRDNIFGPTK